MHFSSQQEAALEAVQKWLSSDQQVFRLFGYAGTGKTTLARHLHADHYAAYTGKAAHVLREKGCAEASTIHSLIYNTREKSAERLRKLRLELDAMPLDADDRHLRHLIEKETRNLRQPSFTLNLDSPLRRTKLLVIDECFVGETLVDTPEGPRRIDGLALGDLVYNAVGTDSIVGLCRRKKESLVKVQCGQTTFYCSRSHPFFTDQGITRAEQLRPGSQLLRTAQAMRLLRGDLYPNNRIGAILRSEMQHYVQYENSRNEGTDIQSRPCQEQRGRAQTVVGRKESGGATADRAYSEAKPNKRSCGAGENQCSSQGNDASAQIAWGERQPHANSAADFILRIGAGLAGGIRRANGATRKWAAQSLQNRFGAAEPEDCHRSGWPVTSRHGEAGAGQEEDGISLFLRVDGVEVLEQGHPELGRFRSADGSLYLYDLAVARHPSFSVKGVLVHNCSMVDRRLGQDLLSFGCKILVLGDPAQLPPVKGGGFFTDCSPDIMLTEIHRQARENPILDLATRIRQGEPWKDHSLTAAKVEPEEAMAFNQIIVGRNATRTAINARCRELLGMPPGFPVAGDKVVCLRNNHEIGIMNGAIYDVDSCDPGESEDHIFLGLAGLPALSAHTAPFAGQPVDPWSARDHEMFDYGYALTCHKSQGSQWDSVLVFDESRCFRGNERRWLYTAVTRAAKTLKVVL